MCYDSFISECFLFLCFIFCFNLQAIKVYLLSNIWDFIDRYRSVFFYFQVDSVVTDKHTLYNLARNMRLVFWPRIQFILVNPCALRCSAGVKQAVLYIYILSFVSLLIFFLLLLFLKEIDFLNIIVNLFILLAVHFVRCILNHFCCINAQGFFVPLIN